MKESVIETVWGGLKILKVGDDFNFTDLRRRDFDTIEFDGTLKAASADFSLQLAKGLLKRTGQLIIYSGLDWHPNVLRDAIERNGFFVTNFQKLSQRTFSVSAMPEVKVEEIVVFSPPGVGDIIWGMNKLKAIRERESPCKIHYMICANGLGPDRAKDFLLATNLIDSCESQRLPLPYGPVCPDPSKPIYNIFANPCVDKGIPVTEWLPEYPSDFDLGFELPQAVQAQVEARLGDRKYICVYFSSNAWNEECTAGQAWQPKEWAQTIIYIKNKGITPVVLGKDWDEGYVERVAEQLVLLGHKPQDVWINLVGKTPLLLALGFMKNAEMTVGSGSSGLTITAAYLGYRVLTFWPKPGVLPIEPSLCRLIKDGFSTKWMPPDVMARGNYTAMHFGEYTIDNVYQHVDTTLAKLENERLAATHGARII